MNSRSIWDGLRGEALRVGGYIGRVRVRVRVRVRWLLVSPGWRLKIAFSVVFDRPWALQPMKAHSRHACHDDGLLRSATPPESARRSVRVLEWHAVARKFAEKIARTRHTRRWGALGAAATAPGPRGPGGYDTYRAHAVRPSGLPAAARLRPPFAQLGERRPGGRAFACVRVVADWVSSNGAGRSCS